MRIYTRLLLRAPMKFAYASLVFLLAVSVAAANFDAPNFEDSEEGRSVNSAYHNGVVDAIVCNNAFLWSNSSSGTVNLATLAQMTTSLTVVLSAITTASFRQCDRLSAICYQCENGAANVSVASIGVLVAAKLFCQANNNLDSFTQRVDSQTFTLLQNTEAIVWTAKPACRATPGCYPAGTADLMLGTLQGARQLTFKRVAGQVLLDQINTGARSTYFSSAEAGFRLLSINYGEVLVPDSIIGDRSLTGIFCLPAKRSPVFYSTRGLPLLDDPS
jgi:hypothetical protein